MFRASGRIEPGHRVMMSRAAQLFRIAYGHGMAQLADDQSAHQHENQGPALPEKLTHGGRVPSGTASCNETLAQWPIHSKCWRFAYMP
jgi:hypothetical protein